MENILLLDTSVSSLNKGDEIIMECIRQELSPLLDKNTVLTVPTHLSPFHSYQAWRNSLRVRVYRDCRLKFACGTNLITTDMLTHFPQWNINIFNYTPLQGTILAGVGVGAGDKIKPYTASLYRRVLSNNFYHSVRDERSKKILQAAGIKCINTSCLTTWKLTPEFCSTIPAKKASRVIFTINGGQAWCELTKALVSTLRSSYDELFFWPQGLTDLDDLVSVVDMDGINVLNPNLKAYNELLQESNLDYVGTRLHGGIYAMRSGKRSIIISIDERASEMSKSINLDCVAVKDIGLLKERIYCEKATEIHLPQAEIDSWKRQFGI